MCAARSVPGGPAQARRAANIAATPAEIDASRARGEARDMCPDVTDPAWVRRRSTYLLVGKHDRVRQRACGGNGARAVVDDEGEGDTGEQRVACGEPRPP